MSCTVIILITVRHCNLRYGHVNVFGTKKLQITPQHSTLYCVSRTAHCSILLLFWQRNIPISECTSEFQETRE